MTPAITLLNTKGICHQVHEYEHDPSHQSYGEEAAQKLNVEPGRVFKTLVVKLNTGELAVAIIPVTHQLCLKQLAKALNTKKVEMAPTTEVARATGYVLGGVSPFGQKKRLRTIIHHSALEWATVFVSGGKRGLEIELAPQVFNALLNAEFHRVVLAP